MDFAKMLEERQSKAITNDIVNFVVKHPDSLNELMNLFLFGELRISQRASWPVGDLGVKDPHLFEPYIESIVKNMHNPVHDAVLRNSLRILGSIEIPEELQGEVYELCFNFLLDLKFPIAIRVFSMTVLSNIAKNFPELKEELISVIEEHYPHGSAGFKSRARKCLKILRA